MDVNRRSFDDAEGVVVIGAGSPGSRRSEEEGGGVEGGGVLNNKPGGGGIDTRSLLERVSGEDGGGEDGKGSDGSGGEEDSEQENEAEVEQLLDDEKEKEASFLKLKEEVAAIQDKPDPPIDTQRADPRVPPRIFVWDYYPIVRRVNEYSKPKWVAKFSEALGTTLAMTKLLNSQFRALFKIPLRRLGFFW